MLPPYFTDSSHCLPQRTKKYASLFQPDNGCCVPAQPTENHGKFRSVRSSGMYSQCVSRVPLICRLLSVRYLGLLLVPFYALDMSVISYVLIHRIINGTPPNVKCANLYFPLAAYISPKMSVYKKHLCFLCALCIIECVAAVSVQKMPARVQ